MMQFNILNVKLLDLQFNKSKLEIKNGSQVT